MDKRERDAFENFLRYGNNGKGCIAELKFTLKFGSGRSLSHRQFNYYEVWDLIVSCGIEKPAEDVVKEAANIISDVVGRPLEVKKQGELDKVAYNVKDQEYASDMTFLKEERGERFFVREVAFEERSGANSGESQAYF